MRRLDDNAALVPIALVGLTLLGAALRFVVAGQDLFADELATYWIVSMDGLSDVVQTVSTTAEITPPLSFALSWLTSQVDLTPELIRLPALFAGVASIPLVYAIGARTVGRGAGLLAAALTTLSPFMTYYSAEARGYSVMMALVLASTLMLLLAVDDGRRRWWAAYAAFTCLAVYTHYTSVFVLGAQLIWVLWLHAGARRPAFIATAAAALLFVPWLPSLRADLDSPTTTILAALAPFNLETAKVSLAHWSLGFPYSTVSSLRDMPGTEGLALLGAALLVGGIGMFTMRGRLGAWFARPDRRLSLVIVLALATPMGEALQSAVSTDVFSTRSLAASWPYLALAGAALITVGALRLRVLAAALAILAFGLSAVGMVSIDYERPNFRQVAEFVADGPGGVVVDAASLTPGPLANFDVEGGFPGGEVLRLTIPEEMTAPFDRGDRLPDPTAVARRAMTAADGGPITVVSLVSANPLADEAVESPLVTGFAEMLPGYELAERRVFPGFLDLQALVYERDGGAGAI